MKKREMEHIEDCCSLEEHMKCWANCDHRMDTIKSCRSKLHRGGEARHSFTLSVTLDENQRGHRLHNKTVNTSRNKRSAQIERSRH